jgi:hypothetical protein
LIGCCQFDFGMEVVIYVEKTHFSGCRFRVGIAS